MSSQLTAHIVKKNVHCISWSEDDMRRAICQVNEQHVSLGVERATCFVPKSTLYRYVCRASSNRPFKCVYKDHTFILPLSVGQDFMRVIQKFAEAKVGFSFESLHKEITAVVREAGIAWRDEET